MEPCGDAILQRGLQGASGSCARQARTLRGAKMGGEVGDVHAYHVAGGSGRVRDVHAGPAGGEERLEVNRVLELRRGRKNQCPTPDMYCMRKSSRGSAAGRPPPSQSTLCTVGARTARHHKHFLPPLRKRVAGKVLTGPITSERAVGAKRARSDHMRAGWCLAQARWRARAPSPHSARARGPRAWRTISV